MPRGFWGPFVLVSLGSVPARGSEQLGACGADCEDGAGLLQIKRQQLHIQRQKHQLVAHSDMNVSATECEEWKALWPAETDLSSTSEESLHVLVSMMDLVYKIADGFKKKKSSMETFWGPDGALVRKAGYVLRREVHNGRKEEEGCFYQQQIKDWNLRTFLPTYCVFEHALARKMVFSIQGSSTRQDWEANVQSTIGGRFPAHFMGNMAKGFANCRKVAKGCLIVGDSLGGYLAEIAATHLRMPGLALVAPGPDGWWTGHSGTRRCGFPPHPWFRVLNQDKDPIGNLLWPRNHHAMDPVFMQGTKFMHFVSGILTDFENHPSWKFVTNRNLMDWTTGPETGRYITQTYNYWDLPATPACACCGQCDCSCGSLCAGLGMSGCAGSPNCGQFYGQVQDSPNRKGAIDSPAQWCSRPHINLQTGCKCCGECNCPCGDGCPGYGFPGCYGSRNCGLPKGKDLNRWCSHW